MEAKIVVAGARNLAPKDSNGKSDPYCLVGVALAETGEFLEPRNCIKSKPAFITLNPVWKEIHLTTDIKNHVRIEVWDHDPKGEPEFEGFAVVTLAFGRDPMDTWVPLRPRNADDKVSGDVHIIVSKVQRKIEVMVTDASRYSVTPEISKEVQNEIKATPEPEPIQPKAEAPVAVKVEEKPPALTPIPTPTPTPALAQAPSEKKLTQSDKTLPTMQSAKTSESAKDEKHIMISYQWDSQEFAKDLYDALVSKGFTVWMDIQGGMQGNIFDSMARAINGAALVLVLETVAYEKSANCKRECELAATRKLPIIALKLEREMFSPTGWLSTAISAGDLWFDFTEKELRSSKAQKTFEDLVKAIKIKAPKSLPEITPTIFLCYSDDDWNIADMLRSQLDVAKDFDASKSSGQKQAQKQEAYWKCIMRERVVKNSTEQSESLVDEQPKKNQTLEAWANTEANIRRNDVVAVILIITPNFEDDENCRQETNLAYSARKLIIPTVWKPLASGFPPPNLAFCLKGINYVDFTKVNHRIPEKVGFKVNYIRRILKDTSSRSQMTSIITDKNFLIKAVGDWNEGDVTNWLRYINLHRYCQAFRNVHINGKLLLTLTAEDLARMEMTQLHQKIFFSKTQDLFENFTWTDSQVEEWFDKLQLKDVKEILFNAGVDGKALLVLSDSDLAFYGIKNKITQNRILQEIFQLKLDTARVAMPDDRYRFTIIKDDLLPVASDQLNKFHFPPHLMQIFQDIIGKVESNPEGITQTGLKKFLFAVLLVAYIYKKTYKNKIIWTDATKVELVSLRSFFLQEFLRKEGSEEQMASSEAKIDQIMTEVHVEEEEIDNTEPDSERPLEESAELEVIISPPAPPAPPAPNAPPPPPPKNSPPPPPTIKPAQSSSSEGKGAKSKAEDQDTVEEYAAKMSKPEKFYATYYFREVVQDFDWVLSYMERLSNASKSRKLDVRMKQLLALRKEKVEVCDFLVDLWLQYLTLDNIITRLFAVWDRMVSGMLSQGELLAGLDMLIYGSIESKVKLAFSLVDFNGDGYITPEEQSNFYKECFVPVLQRLTNSGLIKNFDKDIHPQSLLCNIYQQVKDELETEQRPILLNEHFTIVHYTGGAQDSDPKLGVDNILRVDASVHCSNIGKNFDLVLATKNPSGIVLTNLYIGGNALSWCSSYLKDALIWFSNSNKPLNWKSYTDKFNDFKREDLENRINARKPDLFISTDRKSHDFKLDFPKDKQVTQVHIKFLRSHASPSDHQPGEEYTDSIDLEFLGLWGFLGETAPENKIKVSTLELYAAEGGIVREEINQPQVPQEGLSNFNVLPAAYGLLRAASEVADGRALPSDAKKFKINKEDVDELLKDLTFIEPEAGGMQLNQVKTLADLLPLIHLFRMFYGYDPMKILVGAM